MSIQYRTLVTLFSLVISTTLFAEEQTNSQNKELLAAVKKLDLAFETQDKETIRQMTDPQHLSIAPSYQFFNQKDQLKALPKLKISLFKTGKKTILHTTEHSALITYKAKLEGTFDGTPLAKHVQIVELWVKRKGKWIEVSYQETQLP